MKELLTVRQVDGDSDTAKAASANKKEEKEGEPDLLEKTPERIDELKVGSGGQQSAPSRTPKELNINEGSKAALLESMQSKTDEHIARIKQTLLATNERKKEILMQSARTEKEQQGVEGANLNVQMDNDKQSMP